jgi:hypothetical protein
MAPKCSNPTEAGRPHPTSTIPTRAADPSATVLPRAMDQTHFDWALQARGRREKSCSPDPMIISRHASCPRRSVQQSVGGETVAGLTDVIVGGTGKFTGASGNLSGSVTAAGPVSVIKLSGTITLAT